MFCISGFALCVSLSLVSSSRVRISFMSSVCLSSEPSRTSEYALWLKKWMENFQFSKGLEPNTSINENTHKENQNIRIRGKGSSIKEVRICMLHVYWSSELICVCCICGRPRIKVREQRVKPKGLSLATRILLLSLWGQLKMTARLSLNTSWGGYQRNSRRISLICGHH